MVSMRRIFPDGLEWILGICQGISFIDPRWYRFSFMIYMIFGRRVKTGGGEVKQ